MKLIKVLLLTVSVCALSGCATYRDSVLTPDGFNYTVSREHGSGLLTDYFGLTWNLKPDPKEK